MTHTIVADLGVQQFQFQHDGQRIRLAFPNATIANLTGEVPTVAYRATHAVFRELVGLVGTLHWETAAASLDQVTVDASGLTLQVANAAFPNGLLLVRADDGIEFLAPHVELADIKLTMPLGRSTSPPTAAPAAPAAPAEPRPARAHAPLRQSGMRFLDGLQGHVALTIKVMLDLPVIGTRTLDQTLRVPIKDGALDYRALDKSLDWLEGTFLDIGVDRGRLAVSWGVPIVAPSRDIISCRLDDDAQTLTKFGQVPVRSLLDFEVAGGSGGSAPVAEPNERNKKREVLRSLVLDAIDISLSLVAPPLLEVGHGVILFGSQGAPGLVDLSCQGAIRSSGPGGLRGEVHLIDMTLKDVSLGAATITADRLSLQGVEAFEIAFDGYRPTTLTMQLQKASASKLMVNVATAPSP